MTERRWWPGEVILMEEYLSRRKRQLITVRPQVVVHDGDDFLGIVSMPGGTWMTRDVPGRNQLTVEQRIELYLKEELHHEWYERTNTGGPVLCLYPHHAAHSVRLFWDAGGSLMFWYVNLEEPYRRTPRGIEVADQTLDVMITPDLKWRWKDELEFEALTKDGAIPPELAEAIRAEGEQVIVELERREWPFDWPWPEWRPDLTWPAPKVADLWRPPER
jgi:protein associated with RNAse G/E